MAKHRRKSQDEETTYWLSYSDMMAAVLLVFVLIISFTMLKAQKQYEEKSQELEVQQTLINEQQLQLDEKQTELEEQKNQLEEQKTELEEKQTQLEEQQTQLEELQNQLDEQQTKLDEQQTKLDDQQTKLEEQQTKLDEQQIKLEEQQTKLDEQQTLYDEQKTELDEKTEKLEEQQSLLDQQEQLVKDQQEKLDNQQQQLDKIVGVKANLIEALMQEFEGTDLKVNIDPQTGAIKFDSSILFDVNKYELKSTGKDFLRDFLPRYISVLLKEEYKEYISEIIIEGHTDTDGTYMHNLELSQERALSVAKFCLDDNNSTLTQQQRDILRDVVTANGKSYSNPIRNDDNSVNKEASRRVEFKFRLKDEEMVNELINLFQHNEDKQ